MRPTPRTAFALRTARTLLLAVLSFGAASCGSDEVTIPYSELRHRVADGEVASVVLRERSVVATTTADVRASGAPERWRATAVDDAELIPLLEDAGVVYDGDAAAGRPGPLEIAFLVMLVLAAGGVLELVRRRGGLAGGVGGWGMNVRDARARARGVGYADVAGIDEVKEDLEEVVSFLKDPARFTRLGARAPKGVLLVGRPGTGKTLLARATAGEAGVPFYSVSGSDFVEVFVGVGARRVRKLFAKARAHAPCIVFIDEIDAVGKGRSNGPGTNDEREQTLNQLLVEMDGFDPGDGIVVMAATNRAETLDMALLRPGRFDRRITVSPPDREGRRAILEVHARRIRLGTSVDLDAVAGCTAGFAGADLANLLNEAALLAARQAEDAVEPPHVDAAIDRVLAGAQRRGQILNDKERRIVAYHEAGHAIVAERCATTDPVRKISIVPRTVGALGFMQQLQDDRNLLQHDELLDRLRVLLGGRAAEEVVFGQVSTGAANDLERATGIARRMVCEFGMSRAIGPVRHAGGSGGPYTHGADSTSASGSTATAIDAEVRALLDAEVATARRMLERDANALERVAQDLLARENLDRDAFLAVLSASAEAVAEDDGTTS